MARSAVVAAAFVACLAVRATAAAQADVVAINVDARQRGTPLTPVWAYFGYDEANYTTSDDGRELLATLATTQAAPVHVRTHFLFNTGDGTPALKWGSTNVYTEDADGRPVYDYTLLDAIMNATLEAGAFPLFQFGFMPAALSTRPEPYRNSGTYTLDSGCFYPPSDYEKWGALVREWAKHVAERHPDSVRAWEWELWNEPDIGYWKGTFEEYARLYDHTEAALHAVLPDAKLGGPAVARADGDFLARFLEHCATGENAVTGERGTRLDLVSFHAKGGVTLVDRQVQMDLGNQLRLHRAAFETIAASAFASAPIVISEADPDGCAACPVSTAPTNAYRNSPAYGAYEVAMMKRSLDLAAQVGVNLRGVLTWAFTFPNTPYFAGYRALTTNGVHLPVLNAFKLLGTLRGNRLPVTSSGARPVEDLLASGVRQAPDVDALAASDGEQVRILVFNYHDDLVDAEPANVTLDMAVTNAFGTSALVTHTRVDHAHGDAYTRWVSQGSPETPSEAELAELRAAMEPVVLERERSVDVSAGSVRLSFELPRFGVSLVTVTPADGSLGVARETSAPERDAACGCRTPSAARPPDLVFLVLGAFALAFARRVRRPARTDHAAA